jgi:hypothetical protein
MEETEKMGETLNKKIDTEITLVETKINQVKELMDQELFEHKESVEAKCNKMVKQLSDFSEVVEELMAINEDNTVKSDNKFQLAEIRLESFKEIVVQIVKTKCEDVSRRLGEQLARLESKNEDLNSQIEKVKEMQRQMKTDTPRTENLHADSNKTRNNKELDEVRKETEIRTLPSSQFHKEENLAMGLSNTEVNLPQFDESKETNPMFHLKQLEQYFDLKKIPQSHRLVVACKSVVGGLPRQWLEAISDKFQNYEDFRQAFVNTWWSPSQQSLEKCKLYQDKYDPSTGISFSAHFIKYAKTAAYLEPKPTESEVIEAIRYHFPTRIQRILLSTKLNTIGEAVEFLKRLDILENQVPYQVNYGQGRNNAQPISSRGSPFSRANTRQVHRVHATSSRRMRSGYRQRSPPFRSERRDEDQNSQVYQRPTNTEYREERRKNYEHERREN